MKKSTKTLKLILNIFVWLFVAFAVGITILVFVAQADSDGVPAINGKCAINILTPSMDPTIKEGDLIFGQKLTDEEKANLKVGDIISFHSDLNGDGNKEINTHRIVEINYSTNGTILSYQTQGDNKKTNPVRDKDPVYPNDVISLYTDSKLGGVGGFLSFLQTSTGFLVVIVLPLIAFFIYELIHFIMTFVSVKNSGKKQITAADEELIKQKAIEEYLRQQKAAETAADGASAETETAETDKAETEENSEASEENNKE